MSNLVVIGYEDQFKAEEVRLMLLEDAEGIPHRPRRRCGSRKG